MCFSFSPFYECFSPPAEAYEILNTGVKTICNSSSTPYEYVVYVSEFSKLNSKIIIKPLSTKNRESIEKADKVKSERLLAILFTDEQRHLNLKIDGRFNCSHNAFSLEMKFGDRRLDLGVVTVLNLSENNCKWLTGIYGLFLNSPNDFDF